MRINEVTYGKLKTPLKVNGNFKRCTLLGERMSNMRLSFGRLLSHISALEISRFALQLCTSMNY